MLAKLTPIEIELYFKLKSLAHTKTSKTAILPVLYHKDELSAALVSRGSYKMELNCSF